MTLISQKLLRTGGALVAISMLSACGSMPRSGGEFGENVVDTLGTVGAKTMDIGGRAIASAKDFLGLYPVNDQGVVESDILQNEALDGDVDMALMESETTLLDDGSDVVIEAAGSNVVLKQPLDTTLANTPDNTDLVLDEETTLALANPDPLAIDPLANPDPLAPATTNAQSVATADLIHEVQSQENLWDIAKTTTGDANNWHVLADINNLAPNASVFPGQELIIPADMIKPGYLQDTTENAAAVAPTASVKVVTASNDSKRLVIPEEGALEGNAAVDAPAVDITTNAQQFNVGPGESLWNFAKRTTGDATNWKAIAAQNNFSEKQAVTVYPGQSIYVPSDMVKSIDGVANSALATAAPAANADATVAAVTPKMNETDADALAAAAAVLASNASILDETQPIKIVEAKFQAEEGTSELDTAQLALEANQQIDSNAGQQIMVSGTYYPKAIYNEADFSSSLLMRVSPGTQLSVSKAVGPWYQVMTEKGVGYVHTRDIR